MREKSVESDLVAAEVSPEVLANLQALIVDLYLPLLENQEPAAAVAEGAKEEFVQVGRVQGWAAFSCLCILSL